MNTIRLASWFFLAYLAVLPFAHTTALRNLVFVGLLVSVAVAVFQYGRASLVTNGRTWPRAWLIWVLFLLLFPFWAPGEEAWRFITGQWVQSVLVWVVGISFASLVGQNKLSFKAMSWVSAAIVGVYFLQLGLAISGLYGPSAPNHVPLDVTLQALQKTLSQGWASWGARVPFPFVGYDEMHGNLGYAGTQLIALCAAWYAASKSLGKNKETAMAVGLVLACLLSAVWISSRGALLFDGVMLVVAYLFFRVTRGHVTLPSTKNQQAMRWALLAMGVVVAAFVAGQTILKDERWQLMTTKMQAGSMVEDPMDYMCHGLQADERQSILQKLSIQDPVLAEKIMLGFEQDAGRVVLMRVGWQLVKENPLGIDGSRQAYEKAITAKCGGQPVNTFAHTHNGWMNLALSLGWLGAALYFALLASMAYEGFKQARRGVALPWSSALFLVAFFWIIRGLTDACYQDHYLLMQGIMLGFLYMRTRMPANEVAIS